jgi:hypothetical protein
MKGKLISICVLTLVFIPVIAVSVNGIQTNIDKEILDKPIIKGPTSGTIGITYEYTISYEDPEGDDVYFNIHWGGECIVAPLNGPFKSGEELKLKHTWCGCEVPCESREFSINAQAIDENGDESNWATLKVYMQKNHAFKTTFLNFLQSYPNLFPLIQRLFLRLGLK